MPARHRKPTPWRTRLAGVASFAVFGSVVALPAVAVLDDPDRDRASATLPAAAQSARALERPTPLAVSRSVDRELPAEVVAARLAASDPTATVEAKPAKRPVRLKIRWATTNLNLRGKPSTESRLLTVVDDRSKVRATGKTRRGWAEVKAGTRTGWVRAEYLAKRKPPAEKPARVLAKSGSSSGSSGSLSSSGSHGSRPTAPKASGVSGAPCPDGSAIESGMRTNTIRIYRAVCAAFPSITSWGSYRPDGNHSAGLALDIMISGDAGWAVAEYVRARARELGASEVLYSQRIWTVLRSSEGWRPFADRGSTTANHYDHVHVTAYG